MKLIITCISIMILRCCWGPTEYQIMENLQNENSVTKILDGSYSIKQLSYEEVSTFKLNATFNKDTKQVSGFSGCNRFFGSYSLKGKTLKFGPLGATRMLCSDEANSIESKMLKALEQANTILFSENGFTLFKNKKLLLIAIKDVESNVVLEYTASSRGFYEHFTIKKKHITYSNKRGAPTKTIDIKDSGWEELIQLIKTINVEHIEELEPPSKRYQFDGAALAVLSITSNGKTYKTQTFDHGNPPNVIASLVKEILSIAENIE